MSKEETNISTDFDELLLALHGEPSDEQRRIAERGLGWVSLLLRKNRDYGGSAWQPAEFVPQLEPGSVILVRMGDKIARLRRLLSGQSASIKDESVDDTIRDLGAYCLLYLARPKD